VKSNRHKMTALPVDMSLTGLRTHDVTQRSTTVNIDVRLYCRDANSWNL